MIPLEPVHNPSTDLHTAADDLKGLGLHLAHFLCTAVLAELVESAEVEAGHGHSLGLEAEGGVEARGINLATCGLTLLAAIGVCF